MERIVKEPRFNAFEPVYGRWRRKEVTQAQAAALLGKGVRTFRRYVRRYEAGGLEGLADRRGFGSAIGASPEEIASLVTLYAERYASWSVSAFHREYRDRYGGKRSYFWVRRHLQAADLVPKCARGAPQRTRREQPLIEGVQMRQEAIRSEWAPGGTWYLVVTVDEATSRVYSGFFVDEITVWAGFRGVRETMLSKGLFARIGASWAPDCRSSGGRTQFGRAMTELGVEVVPASPKSAWSHRNPTLAVMRNCLPQRLRQERIGERRHANRFLSRYWPRFNEAFSASAEDDRFESLLPGMRAALDGALCLKERLDVDVDNRVAYRGRRLRLPASGRRDRRGPEVEIREFEDGSMEVRRHGRPFGRYFADGSPVRCDDG